MKHARVNCGVAVLNNFIYVAGGYDGVDFDVEDSVERYNIETDEWEDVAPMNCTRSGLGLVELNGKLYAIGGYNNGFPMFATRVIECYDPEQNRWENKASMKQDSCRKCAVFENKIYAVGNHNLEVYDPQNNFWKELTRKQINVKRKSLVVFENKLMLIGKDVDVDDTISSRQTNAQKRNTLFMEYFDFTAKCWVNERSIDFPRNLHGIAVTKETCDCISSSCKRFHSSSNIN